MTVQVHRHHLDHGDHPHLHLQHDHTKFLGPPQAAPKAQPKPKQTPLKSTPKPKVRKSSKPVPQAPAAKRPDPSSPIDEYSTEIPAKRGKVEPPTEAPGIPAQVGDPFVAPAPIPAMSDEMFHRSLGPFGPDQEVPFRCHVGSNSSWVTSKCRTYTDGWN